MATPQGYSVPRSRQDFIVSKDRLRRWEGEEREKRGVGGGGLTEEQLGVVQVRRVRLVGGGALDLKRVLTRADMGVDDGPVLQLAPGAEGVQTELLGTGLDGGGRGGDGGAGKGKSGGDDGVHFDVGWLVGCC